MIQVSIYKLEMTCRFDFCMMWFFFFFFWRRGGRHMWVVSVLIAQWQKPFYLVLYCPAPAPPSCFLRAAGWAGGGPVWSWSPTIPLVLESHRAPGIVSEAAADCLFTWPDHPLYHFSLCCCASRTSRGDGVHRHIVNGAVAEASTAFYSAWVLSRSGTTAAMFGHQEL